MTEQQDSARAEAKEAPARDRELRRRLGGLTGWWLGLFIGLILLREALRLLVGGWSVTVPIWLVFVPLGMALLVRPVRADDAPPRTALPPVHGRWTAINSPATRVPSHGVRTLGQAFAIDVLHPSDGSSTLRPGWGIRQRRPEGYSCFGSDVLAVRGGHVVHVHKGRRDHRARNTWPGIIVMLTIEAVCRELGGSRFVMGNHVVIDHGDGSYAAYAHLRHGSVGVAPGMSITAGQKIGEVGTTGNTSEPHLHFQLMDRARPARAAGLPFRWSDIAIEPDPDPRWSTAKKAAAIIDGLPGTGQTFHTTGEGGT